VNAQYRSKERNDSEKYEISYCGVQRLREMGRSEITPGNMYDASHEVVHQTIPKPGTMTMTLFIQGPEIREYAYVFERTIIDIHRNERPEAYTTRRYASELLSAIGFLEISRALIFKNS
jgi:hypothetical protein